MASLKDLLVMGPARFLNNIYSNHIQTNSFYTNFGSLGSHFIPANADLNTYKTPGIYTSFQTVDTQTLINSPLTDSEEGVILNVQSIQFNDNYSDMHVQQKIQTVRTGKVYTRRWHEVWDNGDGTYGAWSEWVPQQWTESKNFIISTNAGNTGTLVNGKDDVTLILPQEIKNFTNIESEQFKLTSNRNRSLIYLHMKEEEQTSARVDLGIMGNSSSTTSTGFIRVFSKNTSNNNSIPTSGTQYYRDYYFPAPPDMTSNQGVAVFTNAGGTIKGNLFATNSSAEVQIGTRYNNNSGLFYMFGKPTENVRGLYDTLAGSVIGINQNNFIRFYGTANKADILATSRNFAISATAGTTGTDFNGSSDVSLIIPSSVSGFTTLSGTSAGVFNIVGKSTLYLSSGTGCSIIFCRGGASTTYEEGRFDGSGNFIVKKMIQANSINTTGSITAGNSSNETQICVKYNDSGSFYMFGKPTENVRGLYDSAYGTVISMPTATGMAHFNGTALALKNPITIRVGKVSRTAAGNGDILNYPNPLKFATYGSNDEGTSGWYKVGTWEQTGYADINLNLLVTSGYSRRAVGILCVSVRTSNNSTVCSCQALKWLSRFGFGEGDFRFVDNGNNTWSLYVYQSVNQWGRVQIQILTETGTATEQWDLSLVSNNTPETTEPSSAISSTDGNFVYSTTAPSSPYEGMIWLKPLS